MYLLIFWTHGNYRSNEKEGKCQHLVDITVINLDLCGIMAWN